MSFSDDTDEEGFWARHRWTIVLGLAVLAGGLASWKLVSTHTSTPPRPERVTMVSLPPPPKPIPTPPPVTQPPPEQKVVENKPRMDDAPKPEAPKPEPPKAPDEPPPSLGSNIKGEGADGFGLSGSGNGGRVGFGGNGRGDGNAYGAYAAQVQGRLAEALRRDGRTRSAAFDLKVRLWIDQNGRVTRAMPDGAGSPAANLLGLSLAERPPAGMPMPITLRLVARRPN